MAESQVQRPFWKRLLGAVFYLFFLAVVLAVGAIAGWLSRSTVATAILRQELLHTNPSEAFGGRDSLTLLILGCDKDYADNAAFLGEKVLKQKARSDMMLVAKLDFKNNRVCGVSIPRDLRVDMPGFNPHKINAFHAIARDGQEEELAKRAVEFVLPVKIDRVITIDFDAFQSMVNVVGGVDIDVKRRIKYLDKAGGLNYDFKPGLQRMDGYQAMCYVRHRHDDTDIERQKRQQQFLLSFRSALVAHPAALPQVLNASEKLLDNEFVPTELAATLYFGRHIPKDSIRLGQVPVKEGRGTFVYLDRDKLIPTLEEYGLIEKGDQVTRLP